MARISIEISEQLPPEVVHNIRVDIERLLAAHTYEVHLNMTGPENTRYFSITPRGPKPDSWFRTAD